MSISSQKETAAMLAVGRMFELERVVCAKSVGRIRDLTIESQGDSLKLQGQTTTYYAKQLATQIVRDEFDEVEIINNIEVA